MAQKRFDRVRVRVQAAHLVLHKNYKNIDKKSLQGIIAR